MISSTVIDLSCEREALELAIRDFHFERFRSERMGSSAQSPKETCEAAARHCDVFVLIIAERYGWVIPELEISVVEREYDVAREADDRKILVYVAKSPTREEREEAFLAKVSDYSSGYFHAQPFETPEQLVAYFKDDLAAWISQRLVRSSLPASTLLAAPESVPTTSTLATAVTVAAAIGVYEVARGVGALGPQYVAPSVTSVIGAAIRVWPRVFVSLFQFIAFVISAFLVAVVVAALVTLCSSHLRHPVLALRKCVPAFGGIGMYLMLFGPRVFGYGGGVFIATAAMLGVALLLGQVRAAYESDRVRGGGRDEILSVGMYVAATGTLRALVVVCASALAVLGVTYTGPLELPSLYQTALVTFDMPLGLFISATAFVVFAFLLGILRSLQARIVDRELERQLHSQPIGT
jgi:hypothetical protein